MFAVTPSKLAVQAALVAVLLHATTANAVTYVDAITASNPQYWYRFEGTTLAGGVANQGSTAGFNGTYGAGITAANLGQTSGYSQLGSAMEFTGPAAANTTNKFVDFGAAIPELVNLRTGPVNKTTTVEYWINTSQLGNNDNTWQNPSVLARESPGDGDMYWGNIDSAGNFRFSTSDLKEISATGVANGQWHHVVLIKTWDATLANTSTMHIDGGALVGGGRTFVNTTPAGNTSNQDPDGTINRLGYTINGEQGNTQFIGKIDELAVYNRGLSAAEVAAHYNAGTGALVGLYRFESGAVGTDSSGRGNNLIVNGDATQGSGKFGGGLLLDGNGDFLSVNAGATAAPQGLSIGNGSYAIAAWFKPDGGTNPQGQQEGIVGWGAYNNGNQVTAIRMNGANGMSHYWWGNDQTPGTPNLVDGLFHHVVAMYDATTGIRTLVIDGLVVTDAPGVHNAMFANFTVGRTASGVFGLNEWFDGVLDDVAIFNRALTAQEIAAIRSGNFSAFLGVATIPEPATALTGLVGLALLAVRRRRVA